VPPEGWEFPPPGPLVNFPEDFDYHGGYEQVDEWERYVGRGGAVGVRNRQTGEILYDAGASVEGDVQNAPPIT
jgi:hypothetical protein